MRRELFTILDLFSELFMANRLYFLKFFVDNFIIVR